MAGCRFREIKRDRTNNHRRRRCEALDFPSGPYLRSLISHLRPMIYTNKGTFVLWHILLYVHLHL